MRHRQARGALAALAELPPDEAERVTDAGVETVKVSELAVCDVGLVRSGAHRRHRLPARAGAGLEEADAVAAPSARFWPGFVTHP